MLPFFSSFQELVRVHKCLLLEIQESVHHRSAQNLYQIFITFKERFAILFESSPHPCIRSSRCCASHTLVCFPRQVADLREILQPRGNGHRPARLHVQRQRRRAHEAGGKTRPFKCGGGVVVVGGRLGGVWQPAAAASDRSTLFPLRRNSDTAASVLIILCPPPHPLPLQECSKRANYGKFTLRDLLVVPMQRVLKYPLLLQVCIQSDLCTFDFIFFFCLCLLLVLSRDVNN